MLDTAPGFNVFALPLDVEQEHRAARLHASSVIVDLLFQGPCSYTWFTQEQEDRLAASYAGHGNAMALLGEAGTLPVVTALEGDDGSYRSAWDACGVTAGSAEVLLSPAAALASLGFHTARFDALPWLRKALRADDIRAAKEAGVHAAFLNCQIIDEVLPDLDAYYAFHSHGMRMIQLTYNSKTAVGSGCTAEDEGLTDYGKQLVGRLNDLGILVDTSHCGRQTTLDACETSSKPVMASHTSAQAIYPHYRGKSDEELLAVARTGGVVGIYAVPDFLGPGASTLDDMLDHLDHVVRLIGWQHVGIGTDWPLTAPKSVLREVAAPLDAELGFPPGPDGSASWERNLIGFDDYRDYPNLTRGLVSRGYSDEQVQGILGENFLRVFEEVCG